MKAAAAGNVNIRQPDDVLTSDSSSCDEINSRAAQQTVPNVSSALECTDDVVAQRHASGMEEHLPSLNTSSNSHGAPSPLEADSADSLPAVDNCCDTGLAESSTEVCPVNKLADDDLASETLIAYHSVSVDEVETEGGKLCTVSVDDVQHQDQQSLSVTDSVDSCEQGMNGSTGCGVVSTADCNADSAVVSAGSSALTPCQCISDVSSDVAADDYMGEPPPEPKSEDAEDSNCRHCDGRESDSSSKEDTESVQPLCNLGHSAVACEKDLAVDVASQQESSTAAEIVPTPPSNVCDNHTLALSSSVPQVFCTVEMETKPEATEGISSTIGGISLMTEADCEHGGKASKLDQPPSAEYFTSDDLEESDTGALHMSVGFQLTLQNSRVAGMFDGDSDMTRDTSIGVLMVCDDDGLVSSVGAEPSAIVAELCEDGAVVSSDDGDYESLVAEPLSAFSAQPSGEAAIEKRPSDVSVAVFGPVDENLTEASESVAVEDVMLCEVESKSHEMRELLADIAQNAADTSREAQFSDTTLSHEDSESCRL